MVYHYAKRAKTYIKSGAASRDLRKYGGKLATHMASRAAAKQIDKHVNKLKRKLRSEPYPSGGGTRAIYGPRKKFKTVRPKVISNRIKGVSKSLVKKVDKIINHRDAWGEYIYWGQQRLRQIFPDVVNFVAQDAFGTPMSMGGMFDVRDAASVLWNGKSMLSNFQTGTNNLDKEIPIHVIFASMDFFFKSTSSHVVNIEMYECTAKESTNNSAFDWANSTFDDYICRARFSTAAEGNMDITTLGLQARHMTSLHKYYKVKVHKIKMEPGSYSSLRIPICKGKTFDGSQEMTNGGATSEYPKGTKSFWFRIINDITVSTPGDTSDGAIHAWNSNNQGGVAMRYKKTYRIAPPRQANPSAGTVNTRNVVKVFFSFPFSDNEADQQVTFANPIGDAGAD